jgi:3-dehydroquinate synthase
MTRTARRQVTVDLGERSYDVEVGAGVLADAGAILNRHPRVAVVSQEPVATAWWPVVDESLRAAGVRADLYLIGDGETAKTIATVDDLARRFAAGGLLRGDAVIALGGGVVGDTAGFAAAIYHRGIAVVQAPTTLLAQVDAAIGGKTAVNLPEGKNLVGAFHQPVAVLADTATLTTLPEREYRAGLGEVAKYALMGHRDVMAWLHAGAADGRLGERNPELLTDIVAACAAIKAAVVAADEHERTGLRATLNYGHTLAHALETAGAHELLHGEAVAVGLVFAAELSAALGRIDSDAVAEHRELVEVLGLPTSAPAALAAQLSSDDLVGLMRRDKKASGGLTFVLCGERGLEVVNDPDAGALAKALWAVGIEQ